MSPFKQPIEPQPHAGDVCPVVGKLHGYCPPQEHDSRSACPALNTLANHGYIPRNGKNISMWDIFKALQEGYNLSTPLALFITLGGFFLLRTFGPISLFHIDRHSRIEHDASLVHRDMPAGDTYAPARIVSDLVDQLVDDVHTVKDSSDQFLITPVDVARARVRREKDSPPLDGVHAEIARGEMAIMLGMMRVRDGPNEGVPVEWLKEWIGIERLPDGWKRDRVQGLIDAVRISGKIRKAMDELRKQPPQANTESGREDVSETARVGNTTAHSVSSSSFSTMTASSTSSTLRSLASYKFSPPVSRESSASTSVDIGDEKEF